MSLSVGIVGLPNAGKSTLFNALSGRRLAETAARPFTTIDPHEAVVEVPDEDLEKLSSLVNPQKTVFAQITFIDIAGLVKNAHEGEGMGNEFLAKIREVDAIAHVVRAFSDPNVVHQHASHDPGSTPQALEDIEIVNLELELSDIKNVPTIYVLNIDEKDVDKKEINKLKRMVEDEFSGKSLAISAKLEEELSDLEEEERGEYLREIGLEESGLVRLIKKAYSLLNLISFYTIKGGEEVHAWSLEEGGTAIDAAGEVHTDFAKNFIKAEVIEVDRLLEAGGWKEAKQKGWVRLEGSDYEIKHKDVIEFKTGA